MAELMRYSPSEVALFMQGLGFPLEFAEVDEVYPVVHRDRRVFRIGDMVYKARPHNEDARQEIEHLGLLWSFYRGLIPLTDLRVWISEKKPYIVTATQCLGVDIVSLATSIDMAEMGYDGEFNGFDSNQIEDLVYFLEADQRRFTQTHGLVHGDIFPLRSPQ